MVCQPRLSHYDLLENGRAAVPISSFDKNLVILNLKLFCRENKLVETKVGALRSGTIVLKMFSVNEQQTFSGRPLTNRNDEVVDKVIFGDRRPSYHCPEGILSRDHR